jgi:hypothetical protein
MVPRGLVGERELLRTGVRQGAGRYPEERLVSGRLARERQLLHPLRVRSHSRCALVALRGPTVVMAGLVPAIHVFDAQRKARRGCPAAQTSLRSLRKLDCVPGMTASEGGHLSARISNLGAAPQHEGRRRCTLACYLQGELCNENV